LAINTGEKRRISRMEFSIIYIVIVVIEGEERRLREVFGPKVNRPISRS
jgi:hypothetical protein